LIAGQEEEKKKISPIGRLLVGVVGQELTMGRLQAKKTKKKKKNAQLGGYQWALWGKNRLGADCRQGIEKGQLWAKVKKKK
jgi:hypothetical protein